MYQARLLPMFFMALALVGCLATTSASDNKNIDQLPMYGGLDRQSVPELKAADEELISGATKEFGSREKASDMFVEQGIRYYQQPPLSGYLSRSLMPGESIPYVPYSAKSRSIQQQKAHFSRSQRSFSNEQTPRLPITTTSPDFGASAYYWQGNYAKAWEKVEKMRSAGGTPPGAFINMLREKMPEPKRN